MLIAHNLAMVVERITNRRRGKGRITLFIDLEKAYDSVKREKLWEILLKRCRNQEEKDICRLI